MPLWMRWRWLLNRAVWCVCPYTGRVFERAARHVTPSLCPFRTRSGAEAFGASVRRERAQYAEYRKRCDAALRRYDETGDQGLLAEGMRRAWRAYEEVDAGV